MLALLKADLLTYRTKIVRALHIVVIGLMIGSMASWANAQAPADVDPSERASQLADEGAAFYEAGDPEAAIGRFREALELVPDPAFAYNIAYISEELARYYAAFQYYQIYLDLYPGAPNADEVGETMAELEGTLRREYAELEVATTPPGAQIWVVADERRVNIGESPIGGFVPPGSVTIEAHLDGFITATRQRTAVAGVRLEVDMGQLIPVQTASDTASINWPSVTGWSLVGLGAASVVTGIAFWGSARADANLHEEERQNIGAGGTDFSATDFSDLAADVDRKARLGNIFFSVGLVVAAGGAAILLFWDADVPSDSAVSSPEITVFPGGFALGWSGRF